MKFKHLFVFVAISGGLMYAGRIRSVRMEKHLKLLQEQTERQNQRRQQEQFKGTYAPPGEALEKALQSVESTKAGLAEGFKEAARQSITLPLGMDELVTEAVRRNASAIFQNLQRRISEKQVDLERGAFATNFFLNLRRNIIDQPNSTQDALTRPGQVEFESTSGEYELGFGGTSYKGMEWNIKLVYEKENSSVIEQFRRNNMEYTNGLDVSLRMPLKKNRGAQVTQIKVDLAKSGSRIAVAEYQRELMDVIGSVIVNYWKLYGAQNMLTSWQTSLELAQRQLEDTEVRVKSGSAPETDLLALKSAVALRQVELAATRSRVEQLKLQLLNSISLSIVDYPQIDLQAIDDPATEATPVPTLNESIELAQKFWPEFKITEEKVRMESLKLEYAKNQVKPRLDLVAGAKNNNLSEYSESAFGRYFSGEHLSWNVGAEFSVPLGNLAAKSNLEVARMRHAQSKLEMESFRRTLGNGMQEKIEQLRHLKDQARYYRETIDLEQQLDAIQRERLSLGKIGIRAVLEQQEKSMEYRRRWLNGIVEMKLAEASLQKAVGTLLSRFQVSIDSLSELDSLPKDRL